MGFIVFVTTRERECFTAAFAIDDTIGSSGIRYSMVMYGSSYTSDLPPEVALDLVLYWIGGNCGIGRNLS